MIRNDFLVEIADFERDLAALRAVREPVFVVEQNVPIELEWDELDPRSRHVLARDLDGTPIGTGRLTPERKIGRMAVLRGWRGRGVGDALLTALIDLARGLGHAEVELHAQVSAIGFYEKFGFAAFGDEYDEAGIRHRSMRLELAPLAPAPPPGLPPRRQGQLIDVESLDQTRDLTLRLVAQARRRLWLYTRDLDALLYATPDMLQAIKTFALSNREALVRVLLHDPATAVRNGHGLIALAHRLPSRIEMRVIGEEPDTQYAGAFACEDSGGYLFRPVGTRFEGTADLHGPGRQRQLREYFEQVWERAAPSPELRPVQL
ncbi:GNAT family N-acetyltransferase [Chiayiivirga flava]|uniref:Putative GNAT family N-acyltransferase n=1 Tax=Chiayiivirga flava TaxID=659595 RepID=A0A7W8D3B4_9GAMM|nr:GNAT family N-acetyltransferase [Chiayiivirga flava]MBB5206667.1 putative GNAT family N-acyltransferase [Chiayiivirga flava]